MISKIRILTICMMVIFLFNKTLLFGQGFISDHNAVDQFDQIPSEWITIAKNNFNIHYQHTSHGAQIITGLERIETSLYSIAYQEESLPNEEGALNIYDDRFPVKSDYWDAPYRIPALDNHPEINISIWSWCGELNRKSQSQMWRYYNGMDSLAHNYPNVLFIYMTCNAQSWSGHHTYTSNSEGYNRYLRNEEIRQYCIDNNKVLYDFGDIDAWFNGERATSEYNRQIFSHEHPHYNILEIHHTSFENCENKAKAFWYMMARIAGWEGITTAINDETIELNDQLPDDIFLKQNYPNPFNPSTTISYSIQQGNHVKLLIYDITGNKVSKLVDKYQKASSYNIVWKVQDNLPSGQYFYKLQVGSFSQIKSMIFIK